MRNPKISKNPNYSPYLQQFILLHCQISAVPYPQIRLLYFGAGTFWKIYQVLAKFIVFDNSGRPRFIGITLSNKGLPNTIPPPKAYKIFSTQVLQKFKNLLPNLAYLFYLRAETLFKQYNNQNTQHANVLKSVQ